MDDKTQTEVTAADWQLAAEILGYSDANQARSRGHGRVQTRELAKQLSAHRITAVKESEASKDAAIAELVGAVDQLERAVRFLVPEKQRPDTSGARTLITRHTSKDKGHGVLPQRRNHD